MASSRLLSDVMTRRIDLVLSGYDLIKPYESARGRWLYPDRMMIEVTDGKLSRIRIEGQYYSTRTNGRMAKFGTRNWPSMRRGSPHVWEPSQWPQWVNDVLAELGIDASGVMAA